MKVVVFEFSQPLEQYTTFRVSYGAETDGDMRGVLDRPQIHAIGSLAILFLVHPEVSGGVGTPSLPIVLESYCRTFPGFVSSCICPATPTTQVTMLRLYADGQKLLADEIVCSRMKK